MKSDDASLGNMYVDIFHVLLCVIDVYICISKNSLVAFLFSVIKVLVYVNLILSFFVCLQEHIV